MATIQAPNGTRDVETAAERSTGRAPLETADALAGVFAKTAVERDKRGGTPKQERDQLRSSGLLNLIIPTEFGGGGGSWSDANQVVRRFAQVDSSVAHVFGFQHLMLATARLFGSREQWAKLFEETVKNAWFWGNALNPRDERTTIARNAEGGTVRGTKSFCSGASDSDMLIVSAREEGEPRLIIAAVPSHRSGIRIHHDWDNMGQRQTDSGTVDFEDVRILRSEILSIPGPFGSTFASIRPCISQSILANIYLGIAEGALEEAKRATRTQTRSWVAGAARPTEDPYTLLHFGDMWVELAGARALTDRANAALDEAWARGDDLTTEERGTLAVAIAAAKVSTTRAGLNITTRMFDVMGARATTAKAGIDRYWRNLRTHTLHDPVDYKVRELGHWALNEEAPSPSFYS